MCVFVVLAMLLMCINHRQQIETDRERARGSRDGAAEMQIQNDALPFNELKSMMSVGISVSSCH